MTPARRAVGRAAPGQRPRSKASVARLCADDLHALRYEVLDELAAAVRDGTDGEHVARVLGVLDRVDRRLDGLETPAPAPSVSRRQAIAAETRP